MRRPSVLVLGTGFIGSAVADHARVSGARTIHVSAHSREDEVRRSLIADAECVIWAGGLSGVIACEANEDLSLDRNVGDPLRVVAAVQETSKARFLHFDTALSACDAAVASTYARHKANFAARLASEFQSLTSLAIRVNHAYGDGQLRSGRVNGFVAQAVARIRRQQPIKFFGGGTHVRDFLYIGDLCEIVMAAASGAFDDRSSVDARGGSATSLREAAEIICTTLGGGAVEIAAWPDAIPAGERRTVVLADDPALDAAECRPHTPLKEGVRSMLETLNRRNPTA